MFGHQDEDSNSNENTATTTDVVDPGTPLMAEPSLASGTEDPAADAAPSEEAEIPKNALSPAGGYPLPASERVHTGGPEPEEPEESEEPEAPVTEAMATILDTSKDDLAAIKIQALDELYPLIDKLDLTPDEKFRTLMMMIQASDNQKLIKSAFEAAHGISDEKTKAQALLDIVNEINYFTQNPVS
jgi:hypothetical protein